MSTRDTKYNTETGEHPMDEWVSVNLEYLATRRKLLKRFWSEIEPFHGKTETTVRFPQSVRDAVAAIEAWDKEHPTMVADRMEPETSPAERDSNLKLSAHAATSYAKHCGPNAIQCAEDDLLGLADVFARIPK